MSFFILFFVCLSCFSGEGEGLFLGAWSSVKSGANRLAKACNLYDETTFLSAVCGAVNNAKSSAVRVVCGVANSWWWEADRLHQARDLLCCGVIVSGAAFMAVPPPLMCLSVWYAWAGFSLVVSGAVVLQESTALFLCGLVVGTPLCMVFQLPLVCVCAGGAFSLGAFL